MLKFDLDYERAESVGAEGMFQVISVFDEFSGKDLTNKIDQGKFYSSVEEVMKELGFDPEVTDYETE